MSKVSDMEMHRFGLSLHRLNRDVNASAHREMRVSLIDLIAGCHRINSISLTCVPKKERHNKHILINAFEKQILRLF